jgi:hypothetical protein
VQKPSTLKNDMPNLLKKLEQLEKEKLQVWYKIFYMQNVFRPESN